MAKGIKNAIYRVRKVVEAEIRANASSGGLYARGLANEGYAGGYLQALADVNAALDGNYVSNSRYGHAWKTPNDRVSRPGHPKTNKKRQIAPGRL